jgi:hypothetical protein
LTFAYVEKYIEFEVLAEVIMKTSFFWDIMPCRLLKVNHYFGQTCLCHLQDRRISKRASAFGARIFTFAKSQHILNMNKSPLTVVKLPYMQMAGLVNIKTEKARG